MRYHLWLYHVSRCTDREKRNRDIARTSRHNKINAKQMRLRRRENVHFNYRNWVALISLRVQIQKIGINARHILFARCLALLRNENVPDAVILISNTIKVKNCHWFFTSHSFKKFTLLWTIISYKLILQNFTISIKLKIKLTNLFIQ